MTPDFCNELWEWGIDFAAPCTRPVHHYGEHVASMAGNSDYVAIITWQGCIRDPVQHDGADEE